MHRKSSSGKAKNSSRKKNYESYLFGYNINKELSKKKSIFLADCFIVVLENNHETNYCFIFVWTIELKII